MGLGPELFRGPEETAQFAILSKSVAMYGAMPSRAQFVSAGHELPLAHPEPMEWYADAIRARYRHLMLKQAVQDVSECLNADAVDKAQEVFTQTALHLTRVKHKRKVVNYASQAHDIIFNEMKAKKLAGEEYGIKFGWPTLDEMAEGLTGGDLVTIVGRPGQGKTYAMLYTARHAWRFQGQRAMFTSMEMKPLPCIQRIAAIDASKSITQIKKAMLTTANEKALSLVLSSYKQMPEFMVVDGGLAATVDDLVMLAHQLKPQVAWVDGAYLMQSMNKKLARHERVAEICEGLKQHLAEAMDIPVIVSFQFNRQQKKGMKGDLDNIAHSDAVGQISSVVLGMGLGDDEASPENTYKRKITVIKGRNGETGEFDINWKFDIGPNFMDFSEIKVIEQKDLSYGMN